MTNPLPNFLFHVPMTRTVLNYEQLEQNVERPSRRGNSFGIVHVIDATTHKRMGSMHPSIALAKYR